MAHRGRRSVIVGTGMIGAVHARAVRAAGGELLGVVASSPERAERVASEWGVRAYSSLDAALDDPSVDLVHVCTPNHGHVSQAEAALHAGKHVVCEKPLATSIEGAERLASAAARADRVLAIPFVYRYHPVVAEIRSMRLADAFGPWQLLHGSYLQDWMLDPAVDTWRLDPERNGRSRAFADIGSHWCDLVQWVAGVRFSRVSAQVATMRRGDGSSAGSAPDVPPTLRANDRSTPNEDVAMLMLRTSDGTLASVTISQICAGRKNRLWFELDGSRASAVFDQEAPESAWIGTVERPSILVRDPARSMTRPGLSFLPAGHPQGYQDCFNAFIHDVHKAMDGDDVPDLPTAFDGVASAHLVDAVLRSAGSSQWVDIDPAAQQVTYETIREVVADQ